MRERGVTTYKKAEEAFGGKRSGVEGVAIAELAERKGIRKGFLAQ